MKIASMIKKIRSFLIVLAFVLQRQGEVYHRQRSNRHVQLSGDPGWLGAAGVESEFRNLGGPMRRTELSVAQVLLGRTARPADTTGTPRLPA